MDNMADHAMKDLRAKNKDLKRQVQLQKVQLEIQRTQIEEKDEDIQRLKVQHEEEMTRLKKAHEEETNRVKARHTKSLSDIMSMYGLIPLGSSLDGDTGSSSDIHDLLRNKHETDAVSKHNSEPPPQILPDPCATISSEPLAPDPQLVNNSTLREKSLQQVMKPDTHQNLPKASKKKSDSINEMEPEDIGYSLDELLLMKMEEREAQEIDADKYNGITFPDSGSSDGTNLSLAIQNREEAVKMQLKAQELLSKHFNIPFTTLLKAIHHAKSHNFSLREFEDLSKKFTKHFAMPSEIMFACLEQINYYANQAKHPRPDTQQTPKQMADNVQGASTTHQENNLIQRLANYLSENHGTLLLSQLGSNGELKHLLGNIPGNHKQPPRFLDIIRKHPARFKLIDVNGDQKVWSVKLRPPPPPSPSPPAPPSPASPISEVLRTVRIEGLPSRVQVPELKSFMEKAGVVIFVRSCGGVGLARFANQESVQTAIATLNGRKFMGSPIAVTVWARRDSSSNDLDQTPWYDASFISFVLDRLGDAGGSMPTKDFMYLLKTNGYLNDHFFSVPAFQKCYADLIRLHNNAVALRDG